MKVYAVSCNPGRFERLARAAEPLKLDLVCVDSPLATDPEVIRRGKTCFDRQTSYPTGFAATLGHMRAMKKLVDSGDKYAIIIEDDVRFHKDFDTLLLKCEDYMNNHDFDILTIGFCSLTDGTPNANIDGIPIIENVYLSNPWGCQCYMITREYAEHFLNVFKDDDVSGAYSNHFVTDWVIYDPVMGCKRATFTIPYCVESPDEQSIAGCNSSKENMFRLIKKEDFYL